MKALEILKDNYLSGQSDEMALYFQRHIQIAIKELEELENRSCINCKHSNIRFSIDCNLIEKLDLPKNFSCNKWENKQ